ncbi:hypothetical protein PR202_gb25270 [Eleusine coracana subsp. coracana]|uniref:Translocon-associated protein subunit beta n=1 Tax=Eleusine coracana subsp. coracana TaxID=191504 RepID=A0AAV5FNR3_ELECO|nr:hypothetical protein PR202_gb25270 [Eleusine coracana subsp. coracana]
MATPRSLLLILLAVTLAATAAAAGDAPFVVANKKVVLSRPSSGVERLAVTLDLYNQGAATAYDVSLNDDSWPQEAFEIVSGSTSKIVEKLDPGATASHIFVLETKVQGRFQGSPAVIKYRVPTKAVLQRLVGKYGPVASVVSFVGVFGYLVASPSKSSGAKGSKKKR